VLRIKKMSGATRGEYFLGLTDYYGNERAEPPGQWWGRGAEALGLSGQVKRKELRNLLAKRDQHGNPLVQRQRTREHRVSGWDHVFLAPKSVSNLWAAIPELREVIQQCHDEAVDKALAYLEEEVAWTRRGKGGKQFIKAGLIVAKFNHASSRNLDELLHTHCLVTVPVVGEDGKTSALDSRPNYRNQMTAGAVYRNHLSYGLVTRMGLECERKRSWFEVAGVQASLMKASSSRREETLEAAAPFGGESASAKARDVASVSSRAAKQHILRSQLFPRWEERARAHGLTPEYATTLLGQAPRRNQVDELQGALERAMARITQDNAHFPERELLRFAAEEAQGRGLDADLLRQGVKYHLANRTKIVTLGTVNQETRFTTPEMLKWERACLGAAQDLQERNTFHVSDDNLRDAIRMAEAKTGVRLSNEQRDAIRYITQGGSNLALVQGKAGVGKTTLLLAVRLALEREDKTVLGTAVAGKAVRALVDGSGIEQSYTTAKLVGAPEFGYVGDFDRTPADDAAHHIRQIARAASGKKTVPLQRVTLGPSSVLVIDEAGTIGTKNLERLLREARDKGAMVICCGDPAQHQPVAAAGGPFASLVQRFGSAKLRQIVRQRLQPTDADPAWQRKAVLQLSEGQAELALRAYDRRGLVSVANSRDEAITSLLSAWADSGGTINPKDHAILVGTNEERRTINAMAQEMRRSRGELGELSVTIGESSAYLHDRVIFRRRNKFLRVENGDCGEVVGADLLGRWVKVELDSGATVKVDFKHYARENLKLMYAATGNSFQGHTVENALILTGGGMTDLHAAYVQGSRVRGTARWFTDVLEAGEELQDLARQMSRSRQKDLAQDVLDRLDERLTTCVPPSRDHGPELEITR
jgi:conjugative relaxase-like TrwC/TraI family protein